MDLLLLSGQCIVDLLLLLRQCIVDFVCFYPRVCLGKWATNDCLDEGLSQVLQSNARSAPTMIRYKYGYRLRSGRLQFGDGQLRLEPEVKHTHAHTKSSGSWEGLGASGHPESVPVSASVLEVWGSVPVWVSGVWRGGRCWRLEPWCVVARCSIGFAHLQPFLLLFA